MTTTTTFTNGRIFASGGLREDEAVFATCLQIKDDLITYVGDDMPSSNGTVVDLAGRTILPGFVDGHTHLLPLGQALEKLNLSSCASLAEIQEAIRLFASENPLKQRVLCYGWLHTRSTSSSGIQVDRTMLDNLDPAGRPIYVDSNDLHAEWCNSAAVAELGLSSLTRDPEGGTIHRDSQGEPTGLLEEGACMSIVWPFLASKATDAERMTSLLGAVCSMSAAGYTGAVDMAMNEDAWTALLATRERLDNDGSGGIPLRLAAHWFVHPRATDDENLAQVTRAAELMNHRDDEDLRIIGVKMMCDGVVDSCTAHLLEPYSHGTVAEVAEKNVNPPPLWDPAALEKVVRKADECGLQVALHAIGDGAVKLALDTLEKAAAARTDDDKRERRHRIEHLELTAAGDAERLARLGVTASVQAVHADPTGLEQWPRLIGQRRCGRAFAYKEFLDAGANVALGTDAPTAPHAATGNVYVASTRRSAKKPGDTETFNPEYKLGLCQAVAAATVGSAFSCFSEDRVGRLEVGMKADLAILEMTWDADKMLDAKVKETWFGGKRVFVAS